MHGVKMTWVWWHYPILPGSCCEDDDRWHFLSLFFILWHFSICGCLCWGAWNWYEVWQHWTWKKEGELECAMKFSVWAQCGRYFQHRSINIRNLWWSWNLFSFQVHPLVERSPFTSYVNDPFWSTLGMAVPHTQSSCAKPSALQQFPFTPAGIKIGSRRTLKCTHN